MKLPEMKAVHVVQEKFYMISSGCRTKVKFSAAALFMPGRNF